MVDADLLFAWRSTRPGLFARLAPSRFRDQHQAIEVLPIDFQLYLRSHTRKHLINAMRYRLSHIYGHRQGGKPLAHVCNEAELSGFVSKFAATLLRLSHPVRAVEQGLQTGAYVELITYMLIYGRWLHLLLNVWPLCPGRRSSLFSRPR